jgi:hypothetical protein
MGVSDTAVSGEAKYIYIALVKNVFFNKRETAEKWQRFVLQDCFLLQQRE